MSLLSFDPFQYADRLESSGLDPDAAKEIASAQMEVLRSLMEEKLAAKEDLAKLATKEELKSEILALEERITYKLTIRLGSMLASSIGIIYILMKFGH
jgi:hypothetical protein